MELLKNKRIGKILFIVEGGKHEFTLIKRIFCDILGYKRIEKRRNKATYYVSNTDSHSVVAVINTKISNIESINEKEYLENIFCELIEKYSFDVTNAAIYYIFDRDSESNKNVKLIEELIKSLKNSRENDDSMMGGMLILSYPSIEAFEVSNFIDNTYKIDAKLGADVKELITDNAKYISLNKINEETIIHAYNELKKYIKTKEIDFDIDNYLEINVSAFNEEEQYYKKNDTYFLLSLMSCVLLDLGILRESEEED